MTNNLELNCQLIIIVFIILIIISLTCFIFDEIDQRIHLITLLCFNLFIQILQSA